MRVEREQGKKVAKHPERVLKGLVAVPENLKEMTEQERDLWADRASKRVLEHLLGQKTIIPQANR